MQKLRLATFGDNQLLDFLLNMRSTIIVLVLKVRMPVMVSIMKLQYQLLLMMK
jgi:hypothetical protein